jgi:hypothetical protein
MEDGYAEGSKVSNPAVAGSDQWQGLTLPGGDSRSHGSRGHRGDGVFVLVDFVVF